MTNGTLNVRLDIDSWFLKGNLPVEIRDGRLTLIERATGDTTRELPEGLYRISAMLDDGSMHEQIAQVRAGASTDVVFQQVGETETRGSAAGHDIELPTDGLESLTLQLEHVEGAHVHSRGAERWTFDPDPDPKAIPFARFSLPDRIVEVSLPINPLSGPPLSLCSVRYDEPGLAVELAPERTVASTVFGLIRSKEVLRGLEIVTQTTSLLRDKYRDPVGAALGGLLLQRLGHLEERANWVDNLAQDFAWLPDGRILKSALDGNSEDGAIRRAALDAVLAVSTERPLFTDAFSLLLQTLRRWPDGDRHDERRQALARLAPDTAKVDWQQVVFTRTTKGV